MERRLFDTTYYVGACDRTKILFENLFPVPKGMRYNSYIIKDEKTALLDTADEAVSEEFLENVKDTLKERSLDYLVVHHAEPDHSALVMRVLEIYPSAKLVTGVQALKYLNQFTGCDLSARTQTVKDGDVLNLGKRSLTFISAPMVHWPEVMVSYDKETKTLFSADAFGSFGCCEGSLFISNLNHTEEWESEARRYYSNIVGRFGVNVSALLKKAEKLEIDNILPLHGLVFDRDCNFAINKYLKWSSYEAETDDVLIVYGSMYQNTKKAVEILSCNLFEKGKNSKIIDVSYTDFSYIISDIFKYKNIVFACPTYYGGIFPRMEQLLNLVKKTCVKDRKIYLLENGTWAPTAAKNMIDLLSDLKADICENKITIKSACDSETISQLKSLAEFISDC